MKSCYDETAKFALGLECDGKFTLTIWSISSSSWSYLKQGEFELNEAQAHNCYDFLQGGKFVDFLPEEAKKIKDLLEDLQSY